MDFSSHIVELESRLAFQEDTIQSLNDALAIQQKEISRLQAQMIALIHRYEEITAENNEDITNESPPHY
ncbi:UNVERIFIED_CONTAM: hypothetical protein GTU68_028308 [Idotea baltica]|nr:hypothetical protein [Idotea baltica]